MSLSAKSRELIRQGCEEPAAKPVPIWQRATDVEFADFIEGLETRDPTLKNALAEAARRLREAVR